MYSTLSSTVTFKPLDHAWTAHVPAQTAFLRVTEQLWHTGGAARATAACYTGQNRPKPNAAALYRLIRCISLRCHIKCVIIRLWGLDWLIQGRDTLYCFTVLLAGDRSVHA